MIFLYLPEASKDTIEIKEQEYDHIVKSRRSKEGDFIDVANLETPFLYTYKIASIDKKKGVLELQSSKKIIQNEGEFELCWCVVDSKIIEKTLPFLNELGVKKINFIYSNRSQKNFEINMDRLLKICINSSQQCGRFNLMKFEIYQSLEKFIEKNNDFVVFDFGGEILNKSGNNIFGKKALIGPEGGFSWQEKELLKQFKVFSFDKNLILKSETAAIAVSVLY